MSAYFFKKNSDPSEVYKVKNHMFFLSQFYFSHVTTLSVWFIYCHFLCISQHTDTEIISNTSLSLALTVKSDFSLISLPSTLLHSGYCQLSI